MIRGQAAEGGGGGRKDLAAVVVVGALPMEDVEEEEEEGKKEEVDINGGGGGEAEEVVRVLVVDDSPVDRRIVEMLLKRSGCMFEVISVSTAKKAMELLGLNDVKSEPSDCNGQNIDVILTDYCMPEMTGYDLLKAVKDHSSSKPIPVFIMSSENDPQRISSCQAIGAEDFLLKPLKKNDVLRLRNSTTTLNPPPKAGGKRKLPADMIAEKSSSGSRPRLTKVAVA